MIHLIIDAENEKDFDFASILSNKSIKVLCTQNKSKIQDDELTQNVSELFKRLKFNKIAMGTKYLKRAIIVAYTDQNLLYDNKKLIELVSKELQVKQKTIRSSIENLIASVNNIHSVESLKEIFGDDYEGEKLSVKVFIALCVNYLNVSTGKNQINMYHFI